MNRGRLIVLAGLPGAGKSTHARRLPGVHVSTYAYRAGQVHARRDLDRLPARVRHMLEAGRIVVVDALNCSATARALWLAMAADTDVPAELHLVLADVDTATARDARRRHPAGADVVERAAQQLAHDAGAIRSEGWARVVLVPGVVE